MIIKRYLFPILLLISVCFAASACSGGDLLYDIEIRPNVISPNADGTDDVSELSYTLSREAYIDIYLLDEAGNRYDYRVDKLRSKGVRTAYFSGVIDGNLLADGVYTVVFEATDNKGRTDREEAQIELIDGDTAQIEIQGLSIYPTEFTPNRDGINDRITISYSLNKEAEVVDVYLLGEDGTKYPVPEDEIREMGSVGAHQHDYDGGVDLGAQPPDDGTYTVVVEAQDAVGTKDRAEGQVTISGGGIPMVEIVNAAAVFSSEIFAVGDTLTFTCTVKNIGTVPVRTTGPESGTTYSMLENFNSLEQYEEAGVFRVGLDYEGNSAGRQYPFRWQLGTEEELTPVEVNGETEWYLMPDQTVTIVGHLILDVEPVTTEPYFWIGLIQEQVEIVQDKVEATQISIGF